MMEWDFFIALAFTVSQTESQYSQSLLLKAWKITPTPIHQNTKIICEKDQQWIVLSFLMYRNNNVAANSKAGPLPAIH